MMNACREWVHSSDADPVAGANTGDLWSLVLMEHGKALWCEFSQGEGGAAAMDRWEEPVGKKNLK
jgi:hypothetical protein